MLFTFMCAKVFVVLLSVFSTVVWLLYSFAVTFFVRFNLKNSSRVELRFAFISVRTAGRIKKDGETSRDVQQHA